MAWFRRLFEFASNVRLSHLLLSFLSGVSYSTVRFITSFRRHQRGFIFGRLCVFCLCFFVTKIGGKRLNLSLQNFQNSSAKLFAKRYWTTTVTQIAVKFCWVNATWRIVARFVVSSTTARSGLLLEAKNSHDWFPQYCSSNNLRSTL